MFAAQKILLLLHPSGEMAEWSNAVVLKTIDLHGSGGSNPSLSAKENLRMMSSGGFSFWSFLKMEV